MAKDTTGRAATGMGRYYMDAGWYRHTRFRGLGFDSLFLIEASVGYSLEHATDGRFPRDLEDLAVAFGLRYTAVRKAAPPLFDRGIWVDCGDGEAELVGYAQHNPTKTEIEAMTEDRSKLGRLANHKRWHEKRGRVDPSCPHCQSQPGPAGDPGRDPTGTPARDPDPVPDLSHGMGWDGMGSSSSSGYPTHDPGRDPTDDDDRRWLNDFADAWVELRAPDRTPRYQAKVRTNALNELADQALQLHRQHPAFTPHNVAKRIDHGPPNQPNDSHAMAEAEARSDAAADATRARAAELDAHAEPYDPDIVAAARAKIRSDR